MKETPFEDSVNVNEKMYWSCSLSNLEGDYGRPDTNIFDKQIFERCDGISLKIRLCYRVLKLFRDYFLSCFLGGKFCQVANNILFNLKTEVSSYSLKQVLLQEVIEFSSSGHWKNDFIYLRVASMVQKLLEGYQNIIEKTTRILVSSAFSPVLTIMIMWLRSGCKRNSFPPKRLLGVCNKVLTILSRNKVLISLNKDVSFSMYERSTVQIIMFNSLRPLVLHDKVLVGHFEAFNDVGESMDLVDLTSFSDEDTEIVFCLLQFFTITRKEIDNNNYLNKLSSFKKMLVMYSIPRTYVYDHLQDLHIFF